MRNRISLLIALTVIVGGVVWWLLTLSEPVDDPDSAGKAPVVEVPETKKPAAGTQQPKASEFPYHEKELIPETPVTDEKSAEQVVRDQHDALEIAEGTVLEVQGSSDDDQGHQLYQLEQQVDGIPVWGSQAAMQVNPDGSIEVFGRWLRELELGNDPIIDAEEALRQALEQETGLTDIEFELLDEPQRVIYISTERGHHAWFVGVQFSQPDWQPEYIVVDNQQPQILNRQPINTHDYNGGSQ